LGNDSFTHIENWYQNLNKYCGNIPVVLFANKVDLVEINEKKKSKIQNYISKNDFIGCYVTSAKTGEGVIAAFNGIIKNLYHNYKNLSA